MNIDIKQELKELIADLNHIKGADPAKFQLNAPLSRSLKLLKKIQDEQ